MSTELKKAAVGPAFFLGLLVLLVFGLLVVLLFPFSIVKTSYDDQRAAARMDKLRAIQTESGQKLSGYAWGNKEKGIVQLPVDRAAELVVASLKSKPVQASSVKVENPYPAGSQMPTPAAAAPMPAAPAAAAK